MRLEKEIFTYLMRISKAVTGMSMIIWRKDLMIAG